MDVETTGFYRHRSGAPWSMVNLTMCAWNDATAADIIDRMPRGLAHTESACWDLLTTMAAADSLGPRRSPGYLYWFGFT